MPDPFREQTIENWVWDFCESEAGGRLPLDVAEVAGAVLEAFMTAACERRDVEPGEIEREDVRHALLEGLARIKLSANGRKRVPALVGDFLSGLEGQGRLGGGRALGAYARALKGAHDESAREVVAPIRRGASKLGPNDPCPCGSGRKYKKCCKRMGSR
ncbi:MAG: SEC-C metal-binding domain-containing protein [Planctomycetota bacterium]|jgi:hypothetical protein